MKLSTVIEQARSGELNNLSVEDVTAKLIVNHINLAMTVLYARFPVRTNECLLTLEDNKTIYRLDGTDSSVTVAGAPIDADSVMSIVQAFDEAGSIPIDDDYDDYSIYTTSYDTIQVPSPQDGAFISIIYVQSPDIIEPTYTVNGELVGDYVVDLPRSLMEPLLHYIGYRAHGAIDGNIDGENNTHLMRFEASCKRIDALGLIRRGGVSKVNKAGGFF